MFLKNQWYGAAFSRELGERPLARRICGEPVVLFRTQSGAVGALEDRCPHRSAPLSGGHCKESTIQCGYHGIEFDPSGACTLIPHQPNIPPRMRVRAYPAAERWGRIWIWTGDPAAADPAAIPDYWWFDAENWQSFDRYYRVDAHWELCVDNLLDLSHTPFIHPKTVGIPEMATIPVKTWTEGDKVLQQRVMKQVTPSPFVAEWGGFTGKIDRVATLTWQPPSHAAVEMTYEDAANRITLRLTQLVTPETERSSHVFFAWSRDFLLRPEYEERFREQSYAVMAEDVSFMPLQQKCVEEFGEFKAIPINADATLIEARRTVQRLAGEEAAVAQRRSA
ncbi:MAG: aromatic ring-hydroxylating dioxygenase subunit alpha [Rhodospirillaceae bacterium]|nr:aromatic ring-hydroxylating dioxygenase subunit alpha [Rhodospirillaceae bacterium]